MSTGSHRRSAGSPGRLLATVVGVSLVSVGLGACTSDGGDTALVGDSYMSEMTTICVSTDDRLAALPAPPEQISPTDWAAEVARAFRAESTAASNLTVDGDIRELHRSFTTTTADLADTYDDLSATLTTDPDGIGEINVEITELSLGRDDVATELGLDACVRSGS